MKSRRSVFFSTIVAALGGLLFGFDTAVISGTIEALQEVFVLDEFWLGFTVAIALIGTIVGAFSAGKPGDLFGRKRVLFVLRRGATLRRRLGLALDVRGGGFSGGAVLRVAFLDSFQPALAGEERTRRGGPRGTGAVGRTRPRPGNGRDNGLAFPNRVRSKGQSLGSFTHWLMAAAVSWTFPVVAQASGGHAFAFFSAMMVLQFFFAWKLMPETKGLSLEELEVKLGIGSAELEALEHQLHSDVTDSG